MNSTARRSIARWPKQMPGTYQLKWPPSQLLSIASTMWQTGVLVHRPVPFVARFPTDAARTVLTMFRPGIDAVSLADALREQGYDLLYEALKDPQADLKLYAAIWSDNGPVRTVPGCRFGGRRR